MAPVSASVPDSPSLLAVILDLSPLSWTDASTGADGGEPLSLKTALDHLLIFLNANLAQAAGNGLAVWGVKSGKSELLYASTEPVQDTQRGNANMYEPFRVMNDAITERVARLLSEDIPDEGSTPGATSLVTALTKSLCYINRLHHPSTSSGSSLAHGVSSSGAHHTASRNGAGAGEDGGAHNARILIISASEEESSGYVSLMNCIFSAQKARITIDVCKVAGPEAIFLQQAAHLTSGTYLRISKRSALLQYLMMTFLPARPLRKLLLLPSQESVDFRAACFCHKNIVDVGYVCSVCLSIFCKPTPICSTCKTKFPFKSLQALGYSMPKPSGATTAARAIAGRGGGSSTPASRSASPAIT